MILDVHHQEVTGRQKEEKEETLKSPKVGTGQMIYLYQGMAFTH